MRDRLAASEPCSCLRYIRLLNTEQVLFGRFGFRDDVPGAVGLSSRRQRRPLWPRNGNLSHDPARPGAMARRVVERNLTQDHRDSFEPCRPPTPALSLHGKTNADRKSTRLNSSHLGISYAVFCLNTQSIASIAVIGPTRSAASTSEIQSLRHS